MRPRDSASWKLSAFGGSEKRPFFRTAAVCGEHSENWGVSGSKYPFGKTKFDIH
jgi:hypothetical protein